MAEARDLQRLRVKELNELCRRLGIKAGGRKAEIIDRLLATPTFQHDNDNGLNKRGAANELDAPCAKKQKHPRQDIQRAINQVFDEFEDPENPDSITDDGILTLCKKLQIDAQDPVMLVLSWHMEAKTMCTYTREEFVRGMEKLHCQTLEQLQHVLPRLRAQLDDYKEFVDIYLFTFGFAKDPSQRSLTLEIALGLWELLLPKYFPLLRHWLDFVRKNCCHSVSKDQWKQVLEFGRQVKRDLSNYDENGAWPVVIDDFVAHMKEQIAQRGLDAVLKDEDQDGDAVMEES